MASCIPILKPLIDSLASGQLGADRLRRQGISAYGYNSDRSMHSGRHGPMTGNAIDELGTAGVLGRNNAHELTTLPKPSRCVYATATATKSTGESWDGQSHTSQKGLIQQTKTWGVEIESRSAF